MLDSYARRTVQPVIEKGAKILRSTGLTADAISWIAVGLGAGSAVLYSFHFPVWAVVILWLSGYLDAVDGTVARMTRASKWGNVMDITFDRVVEASAILALMLVHPEAHLPLALDLAAILITITSFLVTGNVIPNAGAKGFHYNPGILERTEAFLFFSLMMLFPGALALLSWLFFALLVLTAAKHLWDVRAWLRKEEPANKR